MAAHPGWATSNLVASGPAMGAPAPVARAALLASHLGRPTAVGALPILFAATAPDLANGAFVGPAGVGRSTPRAARASRAARRDDDARRLFDVSEELTGVRYDLGAGTAAAA